MSIYGSEFRNRVRITPVLHVPSRLMTLPPIAHHTLDGGVADRQGARRNFLQKVDG